MRIRYGLEKEIKDFLEQKIVNYPELETTKLYHGYGIRHSNGFNISINKSYPCLSPAHCIYWFYVNTKRFKMTNKRYIIRSFYNILKQKGYKGKVIMEDCVVNVD